MKIKTRSEMAINDDLYMISLYKYSNQCHYLPQMFYEHCLTTQSVTRNTSILPCPKSTLKAENDMIYSTGLLKI